MSLAFYPQQRLVLYGSEQAAVQAALSPRHRRPEVAEYFSAILRTLFSRAFLSHFFVVLSSKFCVVSLQQIP